MKGLYQVPGVIALDGVGHAHGKGFWHLRCPICLPGDGIWQHPQTPITATSKHVKGDVIEVPVWGECGHDWVLCIGFHKGAAFVWAEDRGGRGALFEGTES